MWARSSCTHVLTLACPAAPAAGSSHAVFGSLALAPFAEDGVWCVSRSRSLDLGVSRAPCLLLTQRLTTRVRSDDGGEDADTSGFCDRGSCQLRSSECIAMNMQLDLTTCPLSNSLPCIVPCAQSAAVALPLAGDDGETPSTCYNSGALRDGTPCQLPQHIGVRGLCVQEASAACTKSEK